MFINTKLKNIYVLLTGIMKRFVFLGDRKYFLSDSMFSEMFFRL